MLHSGFLEFKLDYTQTKDLANGDFVISEDFSAGGYLWRINCYPRGNKKENKGEYLSIFLELVSKSKDVKAIFEAFMMGRDGAPSWSHAMRCVQVYAPGGCADWGWQKFVKRSDLESLYVAEGWITIVCGVIVVRDDPLLSSLPLAVPPSDIGIHLGDLLDCAVGTDVTFIVDGEPFPAHRAVLAARSPVFKAELFGSMSDAAVPSITVQDIEPAAFKVMVRFMYTDSLPEDDELGDSPTEMMQHLLAAADRYALDRLKIICALKLTENISVETVASILACAETYNCPELKKKCLDFFVMENNFKKVVFTDGFTILVQKFPSLAAELRTRVDV